MKINFLINQVFDGWEPTDTRLGGTEESVVQWAEWLAKFGHDVTVYYNPPASAILPLFVEHGEANRRNGVRWLNREGYGIDKQDVTINVKSPDTPPVGPTLYLTNEINADRHDLSKYLAVIWPSRWAADNITVNNPNVLVVPHGYNPHQIYPGPKVAKQCFYASSPDRGLDVLLDGWPEVHDLHPDATLILTYGGYSDLPGVISLGELDEAGMNELYQTSDIWCHPCTGVELYCITGKKAQVAGCIPVIIPHMALSETVERGFKTDIPNYARTLIEVLGLSQPMRDSIRTDVIAHANAATWEESTKQLFNAIQSVII